MTKATIVCPVSALLSFNVMALSCLPVSAMEETISVRSYQAIGVAAAELARKNLDISRYRITVTESQGSLVVMFKDADVPDDVRRQFRGSPGKIPDFAVELSPVDLRVTGSSFIR